MTLWWYVPGVSSSSRRSSRLDGLASSSIWNTVMIPNTLPSTANVPAASATETAALKTPTPMSCACAARSRCSSAPKATTTATWAAATTKKTRTKALSRSARVIASSEASPPTRT